MANPIKNIFDLVSGNMSDLRSNTYLTTSDNRKQQAKLRNDIYKAIEGLNNKSYENTGLNNISTMYTRLINTMKDPNLPKSFEEIFSNDALMNSLSMSYMENKPIYDYDKEIDLVCSYMPKLEEALETKKDHVLSPDHFSKNFLKIKKDSDLSISDTQEDIFNKDIKIMKDKYKLEEFIEESYKKTSKYGEDFVYHVPYSTAIDKMLKDKSKYANTMNGSNVLGTLTASIQESGDITINNTSIESISESTVIKYNGEKIEDKKFKQQLENVPELKVEICKAPYLESLIKDSRFVNINYDKINNKSLIHEATVEFQKTIEDGTNGKVGDKYLNTKETGKLRPFDKTLDDEIIVDDTAKDGLMDVNNPEDKKKINVRGCILKSIPRHRVIPIYIDEINMGYYYFEFQENDEYANMTNVNNMFGNKTAEIINSDKNARMQDVLLKSIASAISDKLDKTFINNNQDLTKEIYSILKYNDLYNIEKTETKMKVTYIPPEDMTHCYFTKDPITHRGISDLAKALIPAKLWVCLNLTYIVGNMTRGQDKRVYYVKQQVDTNISQTLLTTIDQIKRSNFGVRQIENINNILNIIGRFNDYVIPVNQSGESPVQFEVMQGQQIEPPTEIMDKLEEQAINSTDVPLEVINARMSMDFATHYTMSNTRFLRKVIKRQSICEETRMYSGLITRIYNLEYERNDVLKLVLPTPLFLDVSNTSQIIQNVNDLCNNIAEAFLADEEDETIKNKFIKKVKIDYLSTYINIDKMNEYLTNAKIEAVRDKNGSTDQQSDGY